MGRGSAGAGRVVAARVPRRQGTRPGRQGPCCSRLTRPRSAFIGEHEAVPAHARDGRCAGVVHVDAPAARSPPGRGRSLMAPAAVTGAGPGRRHARRQASAPRRQQAHAAGGSRQRPPLQRMHAATSRSCSSRALFAWRRVDAGELVGRQQLVAFACAATWAVALLGEGAQDARRVALAGHSAALQPRAARPLYGQLLVDHSRAWSPGTRYSHKRRLPARCSACCRHAPSWLRR